MDKKRFTWLKQLFNMAPLGYMSAHYKQIYQHLLGLGQGQAEHCTTNTKDDKDDLAIMSTFSV